LIFPSAARVGASRTVACGADAFARGTRGSVCRSRRCAGAIAAGGTVSRAL